MSEARRTQGILDEAPEVVLPEGAEAPAFNPIGFLQALNDTRIALEQAEKTIQRQSQRLTEKQKQLDKATAAMALLKWHALIATFDPDAANRLEGAAALEEANRERLKRINIDVDQVTRADRDMVVLSVSIPAVQRSMHLSLTQFRSVMKFRDDAHEGFVQEVARQLAEDLSRDFAAAELNVVPLGSDAVPTDKRD